MKNKHKKKTHITDSYSHLLNTPFYSDNFDGKGHYTGTAATDDLTPEQDADDL